MLKSDSGREIRLFELCENFLIVEQGACQIRAEYFSQKLFHVIGNKEAVPRNKLQLRRRS